MLFALRYHIIPYSLYFFNLPFYPLSEKRCTFAAQFMKDKIKDWIIQKHDKRKQRTSIGFYKMEKNEKVNSVQEIAADKNKDYSADADRVKEVYKVTIAGSIINVVLLVLKFAAGILGHSAAMIADAIHSLTDFATDVVVLVFVKLGNKPMDKDHDYGHGKYETLATAIIGISLFVVGVMICYSGVTKTYRAICGETLQQPGVVALIAAIVSIVMKEWAYQFTVKAGKKYHSEAVVANAWHHRSDALSSLMVLGGLLLSPYVWWIDSALGILISVLLFYAAYGIIREAVNKILGEEPSEEVIGKVEQIVKAEMGNVAYPHHYHIHHYGDHIEFTFHIQVPGEETVEEAHRKATLIEMQIKTELKIDATIHIEPLKM